MPKLRLPLLIATAIGLVAQGAAAADVDQSFLDKLRAVLDAHPELARSAVQRAEAKEHAEAQKRAAAAATEIAAQLAVPAPGMPIIGNPKAKHTLVELLDYTCGYCKIMHPRIKEALQRRPDVRLVVVMTPVLGPDSMKLAQFALAAEELGKFEAVHNALYMHEGRLTAKDTELEAIAVKAKLDWPAAKAAMNGPKVQARMAETRRLWEKLDRPGTPYMLVGGKVLPGAVELEQLMSAIPAAKVASR